MEKRVETDFQNCYIMLFKMSSFQQYIMRNKQENIAQMEKSSMRKTEFGLTRQRF